MSISAQIIETMESAKRGHDDGHLVTSGHGVYVGWDGEFEYYGDIAAQTPLTRDQAIALIEPPQTRVFRLGSNASVYAPGLVAWAMKGYAFPRDSVEVAKFIADTWSIPFDAADSLLSKRAPFTIEGETVVFEGAAI